ncbi:CHAT domain protein [Ceratobasidium sp. AG-Ba]|nr:CHAT domain protein [Ceratobasidium sp. AG-Ba]
MFLIGMIHLVIQPFFTVASWAFERFSALIRTILWGRGYAGPPENFEQALLAIAPQMFQIVDLIDPNTEEGAETIQLIMEATDHFLQIAEPDHISLVIEFCKRAISHMPDGHPAGIRLLCNLPVLYQHRYELQGKTADLEIAVQLYLLALSAHPPEDPDRFIILSNIGSLGHTLFKRSGDIIQLDQTIAIIQQGLDVAADSHPRKPSLYHNLGVAYDTRFDALGDLNNLQSAVQNYKFAISSAPEHPDRPVWLNRLGVAAEHLFTRSADLGDLNLAISCLNQAISHKPDDWTNLDLLFTLGKAHHLRYEHRGDTTDSEIVDEDGPNVTELVTALVASKDLALCNPRAISYLDEFNCSKDPADFLKAFVHLNEPSTSRPQDDSIRTTRLDSFEGADSPPTHFSPPNDLKKAIEYLTLAIYLTPAEHPRLADCNASLGSAYLTLYEVWRRLEDLECVIEHRARAVELSPEDDPERPSRLLNLADAYDQLYEHSKDIDHINISIDCLRQAALSRVGSARTRLSAAHLWARLSHLHKLNPMDGYRRLIELIPEVAWLGLDAGQRYGKIPDISNTIIEATCFAILYKHEYVALELLEAGRSIVWAQLLDLRAPLDQLAQLDETLYQQLRDVSRSLESAAYSRETNRVSMTHHQLAKNREKLIEQARLLPGMSGFLRAKAVSELVPAARTGAVVVVNVHRLACHALIIRADDSVVSVLHLKGLTHEKTVKARTDLSKSLKATGRDTRGVKKAPGEKDVVMKILCMLWVELADPVLQFLGYKNRTNEELPHITWCTTGPLSMLPLHAAGDYSKLNCSLFNFAISSFTPNLNALLASPVITAKSPKILLVGQTNTPQQSPLMFTKTELDKVGRQIGVSHITRLEGDEATTTAVLSALDEHNWVHFACHANQNIKKPTSSAICLHDGDLDLGAITRKQLVNADLAFLSACQTATGDETLSEESVHIAAAMVIAGFRRVIATMWSIDDEDAPLVAENFYAYMLDESKPNDRKAAKALAYAVGCLRDKVGVTAFERWAPYIHIGL